MERGLLWLPLLIAFGVLAWNGWNEYQKVEAYRRWVEQFDRGKYDIYAVLGQKGDLLTWGKPTRSEPVDLQTFSLKDVKEIRLLVGDRAGICFAAHKVDLEELPSKGSPVLEFIFTENETPAIKIPFTEIPLAAEWGKYLQQQLIYRV